MSAHPVQSRISRVLVSLSTCGCSSSVSKQCLLIVHHLNLSYQGLGFLLNVVAWEVTIESCTIWVRTNSGKFPQKPTTCLPQPKSRRDLQGRFAAEHEFPSRSLASHASSIEAEKRQQSWPKFALGTDYIEIIT